MNYLAIDQTFDHSKDSDCTVDRETNCCQVCRVYHGEPCPVCGGTGFHVNGCANIAYVDDRITRGQSQDANP